MKRLTELAAARTRIIRSIRVCRRGYAGGSRGLAPPPPPRRPSVDRTIMWPLVRRDIRTRIGREAVAVGHLNARQRGSIQRRVFWNDSVEEQEIGRHGIDLVRGQGLRRVEG